MATKTITLRLEDSVYNLFKSAAQGEHRSISNYLEHATWAYLTRELYVSDAEMAEIMENAGSLREALKDVKKGRYDIVR